MPDENRQKHERAKRTIQRGYVFRSAADVPEEIRSENHVFISERGAETRLDESGEAPKIRGHGAVFNVETLIYGHREVVRPGAFTKTIAEGDARGLFNHNADWLLGRVGANTLTMREDPVGLAYEIDPPKTDLMRDLVIEPLRRRDLEGSSFSFQAVKDPLVTSEEGRVPLREIQEAKVYDVGPVTFPAYASADADFRSWVGAAESLDELRLLTLCRGAGLTDSAIGALVGRVMELLAKGAEPDQRSTPHLLAQRLRLAELEV